MYSRLAKERDVQVEELLRLVEMGVVYIRDVKVVRAYKVPTARRYKVVVEYENGKLEEFYPSDFLKYVRVKK